ncbi:energy-coupled thiamine transporter ThiT [Acetonema longum]|nr:energy-coupled thiamine transporter ThiT [Acetonema longum]
MLADNPVSIAVLLGLMLLILAFLRIKKIALQPRLITHIGLALALALILHTFRLYHMPQGGSITLGAMVPLLLIAFLYGPEVGYLAGFVYGLIHLIQSPYILHPVQVLFDYPLPYMALGLAGYFRDRIFWGTIVGVLGRFICHYISGIVFFASYAPESMSPYVYSAIFNAGYLIPNLLICLLIMRLLPLERIKLTLSR